MTDWLNIALFILSLSFSIFLLFCAYFWTKIPYSAKLTNRREKVSVVIPARNEQDTVTNCLESIRKQQFPAACLEVILVDDHSEDETVARVEAFASLHPEMNLRLLRNPQTESGSKKQALSYAISRAGSDIILTTDADCVHPPGWVSSMLDFFLYKDAYLLAGPVDLLPDRSLIGMAQSLEHMGLSGIAAACLSRKVPVMCSGANLMFRRDIFHAVGAYDSAGNKVSGDDTQLLLKINKLQSGRAFFIKCREAIVSTRVVTGIGDLIQQRKRWAGKIPATLNAFTVFIAVLAWCTHALLMLILLLSLVQAKFSVWYPISVTVLVISEYILLNSLASFFQRRKLLYLILPLQFFYWIYITFIGLVAPFSTFRWKGRTAT